MKVTQNNSSNSWPESLERVYFIKEKFKKKKQRKNTNKLNIEGWNLKKKLLISKHIKK
jgi:hypothetical protein